MFRFVLKYCFYYSFSLIDALPVIAFCNWFFVAVFLIIIIHNFVKKKKQASNTLKLKEDGFFGDRSFLLFQFV